MKNKILFFFLCLFAVSGTAQVTCPSTISVGTSCSGHSCTSASIDVVNFDTYTANVLTNEWGAWGSWPNGLQSLSAGAVAIRSYALYRVINPLSQHTGYNICNTTYCHVYNPSVIPSSYATNAVNNTDNYILTNGSGSVQLTEFAAETNDNCSPIQNSGNYCGQCGDGKFQRSVTGPPINGGACYPTSGIDPVCVGKANSGHPRGMCQRGSIRWASGYSVPSNTNMGSLHGHPTKTWQQLLAYYYPYWSLNTCSTIVDPGNDACNTATTLTSSGSCNNTTSTVTGATSSGISIPACTGFTSSTALDVWFKFTAQAGSHTIAVDPEGTYSGSNNNYLDPVIALYSSCSAGGFIQCEDDAGGGGGNCNMTVTGLTANNTYYIRVFDYGSGGASIPQFGGFSICVTHSTSPNPEDITVSNASVTPTNVTAGNDVSVSVNHNYNGNVLDGDLPTFDLFYYLSTDCSFSPDDVFLDDDASGLGSDDPSNNETADLTIPANTPGGTYYIVFVGDHDNELTESNEANNTACVQITVDAIPPPVGDITVTNAGVSPSTVTDGGTVTVSAGHTYDGNQLDTDLPSFDLNYYLSTDCNFSPNDIFLDDDASSLGSDDPVNTESADVTIPAGTVSGTYYIVFVGDYNNELAETDENNNTACVQITVDGPEPEEDISVDNASVTPTDVEPGGAITAGADQTYIGSGNATVELHYYLSTDCNLDASDVLLGDDFSVLSQATPSEQETATLTIPTGTAADEYYILFVSDATGQVIENDESNNMACLEITVTTGPNSLPNEQLKEGIRLYPNPTGGMLNYETQYFKVDRIDIFNNLGQLLHTITQGGQAIDLTAYPPAVYIVKFTGHDNESAVFRVVKK